MPNEPLTQARYPSASAAPNVAQDIQNAVTDLATYTNPRFANVAARDAAYTARGGTIPNGSQCWTDTDGLWTRIGGVWQVTDPVVKPYFQGYRVAAQSVPTSTDTVITWTGEYYDNGGTHTTNGTTFIAPYTAYYRAQATVVFVENSVGYRQAVLRKDGVNVNGTASVQMAQQSLVPQPVSTPARRIFMTVGQTLDVVATQNSGGALNTTSGSGAFTSIFEVIWDGVV